MAGRTPEPALLDEINAAFIEGGVSTNASSRTSENVPVMARAIGCRVSPDRRTVTLLFHAPAAADFLESIRTSKRIAVVFSRPSTHQTIQLKGSDAVAAVAHKRDVEVTTAYCNAIVAEVSPLGYPEPMLRALLWSEPEGLRTVTFTPTEAFLQTPGPRAGERLKNATDAHAR
jgi:hypothetical protein